ncbi:hypothetical protein OWV82_012009 [Melia azedarach]|uniref:Uncharacterized protein n=1 Tax=Melia azedarach TaxID=155640 RepID=A0ACC1Y1J7_MELAZ|nr:hypothetical protein OWV82_012009 [Melia azedarach]
MPMKRLLGTQNEKDEICPISERVSENVLSQPTDLVIFDTQTKKKRKVGMSVEGTSSSVLQVVDISATKRDRYEHMVPMIKSMERVVSRDWAETEGKIGEKEMLRLCSEFNYKMSFWWSKHREQLFQRIDDAHRMFEFERECSILKRDKERLRKWAQELLDQHEKQIQELQKENEYLKIQVADLDDRLAVAIQTQDEIREEANDEKLC